MSGVLMENTMKPSATGLTVDLDPDTLRFVRADAVLTARRRGVSTRECSSNELATHLREIIMMRRQDVWRSALRCLQAAGLCGAEILALVDVSRRHPPASAEAAAEISRDWTHITAQRWRRVVKKWELDGELGAALFILARELDAEDRACLRACLDIYEQPSFWRSRQRRRDLYAKVKRMGNSSFMAVRLE